MYTSGKVLEGIEHIKEHYGGTARLFVMLTCLSGALVTLRLVSPELFPWGAQSPEAQNGTGSIESEAVQARGDSTIVHNHYYYNRQAAPVKPDIGDNPLFPDETIPEDPKDFSNHSEAVQGTKDVPATDVDTLATTGDEPLRNKPDGDEPNANESLEKYLWKPVASHWNPDSRWPEQLKSRRIRINYVEHRLRDAAEAVNRLRELGADVGYNLVKTEEAAKHSRCVQFMSAGGGLQVAQIVQAALRDIELLKTRELEYTSGTIIWLK